MTTRPHDSRTFVLRELVVPLPCPIYPHGGADRASRLAERAKTRMVEQHQWHATAVDTKDAANATAGV